MDASEQVGEGTRAGGQGWVHMHKARQLLGRYNLIFPLLTHWQGNSLSHFL